ncbi:MAG: tetratricopeptide repeat protein, partial [Vicinamibacterales bacterium]
IVASLAVVAESAGRADLAIEAYRRVVASAPHAADIRVKLASLLLRNRRLDEARQQAEFASEAEEEPLRVDAHHLLARIALARRDIDTARLEAERIRAIDGASPLPDFIEGRVLTERAEYDEAIARFDAAVALSDNRPVADLQLARGEALAKAGRLFEAESAMLDEIRAFPASIRAYLALATLYYGDQRPDEAAAVIERMTKSRRSAEAFDSAVRFWTAVGDRARADAARENAHRRLAAGTASVTH